MFDNRKDPMIATVQKVMDENARRRQIEADMNEELGIQDRKQLGHEKHDLYDQALLQRINEAILSPKQKQLAAIAGDPEKIDAPDLTKLRGMKNEAANEEPPFDPDPPRKKRPDEPKTAKGLAKAAMRDMIAKAKAAKDTQKTFPNVKHLTPAGNPDWHKHGYKDMPIKEEEQIDEERKRTSVVSSAFLAGKPARQKELQTNGQEMTYHGNVIAKHAGDEVHVTTAGYGHSPSTRGHINGVLNRLGAPGLSQKKGKLMHGDTEVGTRDWIKIKKPTATMSEEQIDEISKKTLGSYIKKASHDAAHKSAIVGKMALRSSTKYDDMDFVGSRKDNDAAEKSFGKSWKRRKGIAKAVDKLTNEDFSLESIQEEIRNNLLERANYLLEHGSQEQIVEFMNDLTMEQRSILNMQEARFKALDLKTGRVSAANIPAAPPTAPAPPTTAAPATPTTAATAPAVPSGITRRDTVATAVGAVAGAGATKALSGGAPATAKPAETAVPLPTPRPDGASAKPAPATAGPATPAPAAAPKAAASSAPRASAPAAARPEIRRTGEGGSETAQDFNYNQANGAYNEPKAAAAPRAARAAPAAAKPAAASASATLSPRKGTEIGSPVAGGDDRLDSKPERLGDPQYHKSQDAAANLAGLQKSATDSAEKTADAFGPGTQTAKPAAKPVAAPTDRETNSFSESRNFERFLRNR